MNDELEVKVTAVEDGKPVVDALTASVIEGLRPTDIVVIRYTGSLSREQLSRIRADVRTSLPSGQRVMVCEQGMDVEILDGD